MSFQKQNPSQTPSQTHDGLAIVFVDMVNSTGLYEAIGDSDARTLVLHYLQTISELSQKNSGTIVKTLGDGILAYFEEVDDAIQTAIDIHSEDITLNNNSVLSHIGIHYGNIIFRDNDVYGDAVNIASRMVDIAKSRQSIISEQAYEQASHFFKIQCRNIDQTIVKGKKEAINIYELLNASDDQTILFSSDSMNLIRSEKNLSLLLNKQHYILNQENSSISMGRSTSVKSQITPPDKCNIVINSPLISRHHAKINYHKGKFIFIDQSTNGSYIKDNKQELFLRREQSILPEKGTISLGIQTEKNTQEHLIVFEIN